MEEPNKIDLIKPQMQLRCRVDGSLLGLLRDFVSNAARHLHFSEEEVAEIEISVDEACANVMEHAYPDTGGEAYEVTVDLYLAADRITVKIHDRGLGNQDMQDLPESIDDYLDLSRERFRGLGILLMRKFMNEVQIDSKPGEGTTVEMTKIRR